MGEREPIGEVLGGLGGGEAIERHHSRRNAGRARELGPPSIADGHDLNTVRAPADSLFEAMSNHSVLGWTNGTADLTPRAKRIKRSATRRGVHTAFARRAHRCPAPRKIFVVAGSQQLFHRASTGFPQHARSTLVTCRPRVQSEAFEHARNPPTPMARAVSLRPADRGWRRGVGSDALPAVSHRRHEPRQLRRIRPRR